MDKEEFLEHFRTYWPVWVASFSAIFSAIDLILDLGYSIFPAILFSASFSALLAYGLFYYVRGNLRSKKNDIFTTCVSEENYEILDPIGTKAVYQRKISFIANQSSTSFHIRPTRMSGIISSPEIFKCNDPSSNFRYSESIISGQRFIEISLGRLMKRNDRFDDLCIRWEATNSFMDNHEAVNVRVEPGQQSCIMRVLLPGSRDIHEAKWVVTYGNKLDPISEGRLDVVKNEGKSLLAFDFTNYIEPGLGELRFSIEWYW
ncbi:hypothetical protein [Candidatus Leptofilum sp.]|uniref:hypothetical protein n=1 Tax=Candidatus Leptofilum sp. TaxID=3241576 RepID=UPI003B5A2D76